MQREAGTRGPTTKAERSRSVMREPSPGQAAVADRSDRRRCLCLQARYGPVESFRARESTLAGSISRFCATPGGGVKVSSLSYRLEASQEAIVRGHCLGTTIAFPSVKPETPTMQFTGRSPDGIADEE